MVDLSGTVNVTAYQQVITNDALTVILPVLLYGIGIAIYGILVWHFYRHLARRDIFEMGLAKSGLGSFMHGVWYVVKYIFAFPLFVFLWFSILSLLLILLAKNQTLQTILLISMGVVGGVRITAYYSEDLSKDLAKMLPFALLGVFLVDRSFLNIALIKQNLTAIPTFGPTILLYGVFVIGLEFALRILHAILKKLHFIKDLPLDSVVQFKVEDSESKATKKKKSHSRKK